MKINILINRFSHLLAGAFDLNEERGLKCDGDELEKKSIIIVFFCLIWFDWKQDFCCFATSISRYTTKEPTFHCYWLHQNVNGIVFFLCISFSFASCSFGDFNVCNRKGADFSLKINTSDEYQ
jgi:hypothetical protein